MGWASAYIDKLRKGEPVSFRPRGNSMTGKIESGQLCTVEPVDPSTLGVGDIVLCKVRGREYLHLVKALQGPRFQIGNNRGLINGWITAGAIFRLTSGSCWRNLIIQRILPAQPGISRLGRTDLRSGHHRCACSESQFVSYNRLCLLLSDSQPACKAGGALTPAPQVQVGQGSNWPARSWSRVWCRAMSS